MIHRSISDGGIVPSRSVLSLQCSNTLKHNQNSPPQASQWESPAYSYWYPAAETPWNLMKAFFWSEKQWKGKNWSTVIKMPACHEFWCVYHCTINRFLKMASSDDSRTATSTNRSIHRLHSLAHIESQYTFPKQKDSRTDLCPSKVLIDFRSIHTAHLWIRLAMVNVLKAQLIWPSWRLCRAGIIWKAKHENWILKTRETGHRTRQYNRHSSYGKCSSLLSQLEADTSFKDKTRAIDRKKGHIVTSFPMLPTTTSSSVPRSNKCQHMILFFSQDTEWEENWKNVSMLITLQN